jgi:hypothetical protein
MSATGISLMHAGPNQGAFGTGIDHTARSRGWPRYARAPPRMLPCPAPRSGYNCTGCSTVQWPYELVQALVLQL